MGRRIFLCADFFHEVNLNLNNANVFLEREPVSKLMVKYSVPLIVSLLVAALYNAEIHGT